MSNYNYTVQWPIKNDDGTYWFLPAHDEYCIESADEIHITKSFGDRINKANMGQLLSGKTTDGKKIIVKIAARRY